jgi:hypothetical protein
VAVGRGVLVGRGVRVAVGSVVAVGSIVAVGSMVGISVGLTICVGSNVAVTTITVTGASTILVPFSRLAVNRQPHTITIIAINPTISFLALLIINLL